MKEMNELFDKKEQLNKNSHLNHNEFDTSNYYPSRVSTIETPAQENQTLKQENLNTSEILSEQENAIADGNPDMLGVDLPKEGGRRGK